MDYTPKQLHYFKRELITLQLEKEINRLIASPDISSLLDSQDLSTDFPFLRYIFHNIIIEFPLLKHTCDDQFWPKCKLFLNEFQKVGLDGYHAPRHTQGALQRKAVKHKIQKSLVFAFCASIKTFQGQEESMKVTSPSSPLVLEEHKLMSPHSHHQDTSLTLNIVTVRQVKEKKTLREISHAEFLIESTFPNEQDPYYVARRHGDFRRLRDQLRHEFKQLDIPPVPSKANPQEKQAKFREQDRLLLRTWLHQLVGEKNMMSPSQQSIAQSGSLRQFLTENPITFTMAEEKDTLEREKLDQQRWVHQQDAQKELDRRVFELDDTLDVLKKEILQPGGLIQIFNIIKSTSQVVDLPVSLKKAFEWGRIK